MDFVFPIAYLNLLNSFMFNLIRLGWPEESLISLDCLHSLFNLIKEVSNPFKLFLEERNK